MKHSKECLDLQQQYADRQADWAAQWPNYCRECDGFGLHAGKLFGHRDEPPDEGEPCDCVENSICPRCGKMGLAEISWEDRRADEVSEIILSLSISRNLYLTAFNAAEPRRQIWRQFTDVGEGPCKYCGWNYDDGMPNSFEGPCECELKLEQAMWAEMEKK